MRDFIWIFIVLNKGGKFLKKFPGILLDFPYCFVISYCILWTIEKLMRILLCAHFFINLKVSDL